MIFYYNLFLSTHIRILIDLKTVYRLYIPILSKIHWLIGSRERHRTLNIGKESTIAGLY